MQLEAPSSPQGQERQAEDGKRGQNTKSISSSTPNEHLNSSKGAEKNATIEEQKKELCTTAPIQLILLDVFKFWLYSFYRQLFLKTINNNLRQFSTSCNDNFSTRVA